MNETIRRFAYPATLVSEYEHWLVLLRPAQPTLGSLVLAAKSDSTAFAGLPAAAFTEQAKVVADIETALTGAIGYARINYLMLMMVDPHVHYHVIPRYEGGREWQGMTFRDAGWPKVPMLGKAMTLETGQIATMTEWLKGHWPRR